MKKAIEVTAEAYFRGKRIRIEYSLCNGIDVWSWTETRVAQLGDFLDQYEPKRWL